MLDLEDSVAPSAKVEARAQVVAALGTYAFERKVRAVRVNGCDTEWCFEDIIAVVEGAGARLDTIIVPKLESAAEVHFVDGLLTQLERKLHLGRAIGLELQIESPRGMERIAEIAAASPRTECLVFGPADFEASLGVPELTVGRLKPEYPGDYWHYFLTRIVVAAKANGLQAIDGPFAQFADQDGLRAASRRDVMLGYDGKWAIHPTQIDVLNELFSPRQEDIDRAAAIVAAYKTATEVDMTGAVTLHGEMIDEASRRLAVALLDRAALFGLRPGASGGKAAH